MQNVLYRSKDSEPASESEALHSTEPARPGSPRNKALSSGAAKRLLNTMKGEVWRRTTFARSLRLKAVQPLFSPRPEALRCFETELCATLNRLRDTMCGTFSRTAMAGCGSPPHVASQPLIRAPANMI